MKTALLSHDENRKGVWRICPRPRPRPPAGGGANCAPINRMWFVDRINQVAIV
jgi:hypothetical protein